MDSNNKTVLFSKRDNIGFITLNRPERLNTANDQLFDEFISIIAEAGADDEVRALILTGAGRAFCAGADFRFDQVASGEVSAEKAEDTQSVQVTTKGGYLLNRVQRDVILALQRLAKPTIAMVNGVAVGGGFDFALACDIRVGSEKARFKVGYTRAGVIPDNGGTWLLPRIVGLGRALELIFTDDFCDAEEAYRIGILNKLVSSEELEAVTTDLAQRIASGPPLSHRLNKVLVYKGLGMDLETSLQFLSACLPIVLSSEDYKEAIKSFANKTTPIFKGR